MPVNITDRLIPAHAGKTCSTRQNWRPPGAHPRSRGENRPSAVGDLLRPGSSPLTRGKRRPAFQGRTTTRLIPAHAGKTAAIRPFSACFPAHPRSRGENDVSARRLPRSAGSSPLTRGKLIPRACIPGVPGLIPAHAGKTPRRHGRRATPPAHPRSRGENLGSAGFDPCGEGSSPLTRGKLRRDPPPRRDRRLIPAHAGKTS